jgi:GNAT superfamily N-acetyltransferase
LITHFLGAEEVAAYNRDFAIRLEKLGPNFPTHWFALGLSGRKVVDELIALLPDDLGGQIVLGLAYLDRSANEIRFSDKTTFDDVRLDGKSILVLDAAVHSGRSMSKLIERLEGAGAKEILSYSLVLKRGSVVIPTYFGVVIDDTDRIYFDLPVIPNNRLANPAPTGVLRTVIDSDLERPIAEVGPPFAGLTVGDLIYDRETHDAHVYVFEYAGELVGFVSFRKLGATLFVDAWYGAKRYAASGQKMKIGSALFRWTETWGRSARCQKIELWAYEPAFEVYEFMGFKPTEPDWRSLGGGQKYRVMEKKILYNIRVTDEFELEYR